MAKDTYLNKEGLTTYHAKILDKYNGLVQEFDTLDTFVDKLETYVLKNAFSKISITDDTSSTTTNSKDDADSYSGGREGATFRLTVTGGLAIVDADKTAHTVKISGQSILDKFKDLKALAYKDELLASDIPDLDASKITDGTLAPSRLPIAGTTSASLGGIFVSSTGNLTLSGSGELKLTKDNVVAALEYTPLKSVPTATYNTLGLLKPSKSYSIGVTLGTEASADTSTKSISINAITSTDSRYYAVEVDKNGVPFINVPWKNTEYKANRGLSLIGGYFGHSNDRDNSTETTIKEGGATRTLSYGGTFNIPSVTYDQYGHIVDSGSITLTLPASDNTDTKVTSVENHYAPTKSGTYDVNASSTKKASWGSTSFVTGVTLGKDAAGHITELSVDSTQFPSLPTKSDIGLGNVENTALSTWTGSTSITTLGTITAGAWNGSVITSSYIGSHAHAISDVTDLQTSLNNKPDKATTLAGYGITDGVTQTVLTDTLKGYLPLTGGTLTGAVIAPSFQTGTADTSYFQTKKMRGQGDASEYRHSVDWGYSGHDQVDFYEYGATWNFYQCQSQAKTGAKLVGSILSTGWNGGAVLSGTPTAPTASKGTSTDQIATTAFVQTTLGDYYTKTEIDTKLVSSMTYKGSKDYYADLPKSNNTVGDVWNVANYDSSKTDWGHNYAWNGTGWDDLGGNVDLTLFYNKTEVNAFLSKKLDTTTKYALSDSVGGVAISAKTLGSSNVGSGVNPMYLASGVATPSSSTVGKSTVPVYLNAGTITSCGYSFTSTAPTNTTDNSTIPTSAAVYTAIYNAIDKAIASSY